MKFGGIKTGTAIYFLLSIALLYSCSILPEKKIHKSYTVVIKNMQFQPSTLVIQKEDTVVFLNNDILIHNITDETNKSWSSPALSTNKVYSKVFKVSLDYFCVFHPAMKGRIVVK